MRHLAIQAGTLAPVAEVNDRFAADMRDAIDPLRRYALRLTRDEIARDDLVQDTVLRAWAARLDFVWGSNFKAWLFRIARNAFLNGLRRSRRHVYLPDDDLRDRLVIPPEQEGNLHMADLRRAIGQLPRAQALALLAANDAVDGQEEVARRLGINLSTFRSRLFRARAAVLAFLDQGTLAGSSGPEERDLRRRRALHAAWMAAGRPPIG